MLFIASDGVDGGDQCMSSALTEPLSDVYYSKKNVKTGVKDNLMTLTV